jgi:uncharacterized membrane protein YeaQ/YmgE (transglycosylase-associated protein family)
MLTTVLLVMASGFVWGALARLALPGPDPMPLWLTIAIGLVGSTAGGFSAAALSGRNPYAVSTGAFLFTVVLVGAYRHFVQRRPLWGPEALRYPTRGVGVADARARLRRHGIDPDKLRYGGPPRRDDDSNHDETEGPHT